MASDRELDDWGKELDAAAAPIPPQDHERFHQVLAELEKESKEALRRGWAQP